MNVRTLCLGILAQGESSGYEIKKAIEDGLYSHFIDASYGSIYPALTQLTAEGLLTVRAEEQTGKPDKKVYAITPAGLAALTKSLAVLPAKNKIKSEFLFQMLLMDHVPHHIILEAVDKHLADLNGELNRIEECQSRPDVPEGHRFVSGYGHALMSATAAYLEGWKAEKLKSPAAQAAE
jgi:DNA-binding PadR family transcriptional regulator